MLEKREALLHKKMAAELGKAREFNRLGKKRSALQCLKKKKLYEQQVDNLQNHQLKLEEQVITLEGTCVWAFPNPTQYTRLPPLFQRTTCDMWTRCQYS